MVAALDDSLRPGTSFIAFSGVRSDCRQYAFIIMVQNVIQRLVHVWSPQPHVFIEVVIVNQPNFVKVHLGVHLVARHYQSLESVFATAFERQLKRMGVRIIDDGYGLDQSPEIEYSIIDTAMF